MSVTLAPDLAERPARAAPAVATDAMWPLWCAVGSSLAAAFGVHWDIAWHRSIGRDSFWTPPHVAIYAAAVLAAVAALARIVPATLGREGAGASVRVLGFRGPLGAFISAWGGGAMLASAPFDDWWHNAYGLDVKILSPPHVVLALGIIALHVGALVMLAGALNRSAGSRRSTLELLLIVVGGNMLVGLLTLFMEKTVRPFMHLGSFYLVVGLTATPVLAAVQGATGPPLGRQRLGARLFDLPAGPALDLSAGTGPTQAGSGAGARVVAGAARVSLAAAAGGAGAGRLVLAAA